MAKDLPYFKFFCSEWSDGDITLEDYEAQGLFINLCSYYWSNECNLEFKKAQKKFKDASKDLWQTLLDSKIIKDNDGFLVITFLDEQSEERKRKSKVNSKAGKASAEARRLAKLERESNEKVTDVKKSLNVNSTIKKREEKKREDNITERKTSFRQSIASFIKSNPDKYPKQLYIDFEEYWSEHGLTDKKMRFEKEKTFGLSRRLSTWFKNDYNNSYTQKKKPVVVPHWNQKD